MDSNVIRLRNLGIEQGERIADDDIELGRVRIGLECAHRQARRIAERVEHDVDSFTAITAVLTGLRHALAIELRDRPAIGRTGRANPSRA